MKIDRYLCALAAGALLIPSVAVCDEWHSSRPDGHAPIGVMGDHTHSQGEWMVSYRFMRMDMEGSRSGTDQLTDQQVLDQGFMVTPTEMPMDMHMLGAMYATSDRLTLMAMFRYLTSEMDHLTAMGGRFTTESSGPGDTSLSALYQIWEGNGQTVHVNAGVSLPTGSINEQDVTPASGGADVQLPYPMQVGSGTFDLLPGITWLGQGEAWSWGAQGMANLRLGQNSIGYSLGDRFDVTGWIARRLGQRVSGSLRLHLADWADIDGADPSLNPAMVPTARTDLRAGTRADALVGLNIHLRGGHRFAAEVGVPVLQDLDGPQLETDLTATVGWQYSPPSK